MNTQPLFSVLIANYNNGKYIKDAINSVIAQTYSNWEIIIVDDGSSDNSRRELSTFSTDKRIHLYYNEQNRGCGFTKRRCVELSNGELCGFLDSDDVLLNDALAVHANIHLQKPDISCCFSRFYVCDEHLNIIDELRLLQKPDNITYFENGDYMPEHFASFKRNLYTQTPGISPILPAAVDQDLYFKLEEVSPIYISDKFTYKYRSTPNQISQNTKSYEALLWNLLVRHDTASRRRLQLNNPAITALYKKIQDLSLELDSNKCNREELIQVHQTLDGIQSSIAYRIGKTITKPFSYLR